MINKAIERVRQMELYFDTLQTVLNTKPDAIREDESVKWMLQILLQYYESGQWLQDYELDEMGVFPQNMTRGVLAQDAVYDFLEQMKSVDGGE